MRASRSVLAACVAAVTGITACNMENINNNTFRPPGTVIGSTDTTIGNCRFILTVSTTGGVNTAPGYSLEENESRDNFAHVDSPTGCPVVQDFDWTSSDASRVEVDRITATIGRTTGRGPGPAMITAIWTMNRDVNFPFTVTVPGSQGTNPSMNAIGPFSTGNACTLTFQGSLNNPSGVAGTWSVDNFGGGLTGVSVNSSTGAGTLSSNTSGTFRLTFTPSNSAIPAVHTTVVVNNTNCTNPPAVSIGPSGATISTGNGCVRTLQMTVSPLGTAGVWSVSGLSGATITTGGLLTAPENSSSAVTVTFDPTNGDPVSIQVAVNNTNCVTPAPIVTISPSSLCFSMQPGQTLSLPIEITRAENISLSELRVGTSITSAQPVNGGFLTVSGSGANWTITATNSFNALTNGNVFVFRDGSPGVPLASIPVAIHTTLCPGQNSSISYSPAGGSFDGTQTLNANCVQGSTDPACDPFWTSSDPSRITVRGNTARVINGVTFWTGLTATLTEIAAGTAEICAQWSITQTTPRFCSTKSTFAAIVSILLRR